MIFMQNRLLLCCASCAFHDVFTVTLGESASGADSPPIAPFINRVHNDLVQRASDPFAATG